MFYVWINQKQKRIVSYFEHINQPIIIMNRNHSRSFSFIIKAYDRRYQAKNSHRRMCSQMSLLLVKSAIV